MVFPELLIISHCAYQLIEFAQTCHGLSELFRPRGLLFYVEIKFQFFPVFQRSCFLSYLLWFHNNISFLENFLGKENDLVTKIIKPLS